jgi:hypothetical protein
MVLKPVMSKTQLGTGRASFAEKLGDIFSIVCGRLRTDPIAIEFDCH